MMETFSLYPVEWGLSVGALAVYGVLTFLAFTVASTLGIGGPLILLPALMLTFSPAESVAMLVPAMLVNNMAKILLFGKYIRWRPAALMAATALPAALAGAMLTGRVPSKLIQLAVAVMILLALASRYVFRHSVEVRAGGLILWGIPTGFISGLSGTAGPPMAIAMKGYGLSLEPFVATTACMQACLQLIRLPAYCSQQLLGEHLWSLAILLALCTLPAVFAGRQLLRKMKPQRFRLSLDLLLLLVGISLFIKALGIQL
ncbi:MAG: sulfite exporter TauE/SafE family protein [Bacteroidetes bacterium]|nr:MAG: sulfite exporter TauE/SafE family protein [Bacteroidota bacterium]